MKATLLRQTVAQQHQHIRLDGIILSAVHHKSISQSTAYGKKKDEM